MWIQRSDYSSERAFEKHRRRRIISDQLVHQLETHSQCGRTRGLFPRML